MYSRNRSVLLRSSASALCNNLTVLNRGSEGGYLAVVHKSSVSVVSVNDDQQQTRQITCKGPPGYKKIVLQAKWCEAQDLTVLVIAFHQGIQIMDADGSVLLFWYHFGESEAGTFGRGIAAVDNNVYVGTHNGQILNFSLCAKGNSVTQRPSISSRASAITDLASNETYMLSASEDASLTLWCKQQAEHLAESKTFDGDGFPATSVAIWRDYFAAGYGSGMIHIFSLMTTCKVAEIAAHARWITAVEFAENTGMLLSTSEDSFVRLWQIGESGEVALKQSICFPDTQLCGGCFLDRQGTSFALTGYELEEVLICTAD